MNFLADKWMVGGLVSSTADMRFRAARHLALPEGWSSPDALDNRADVTPTEDQGTNPCCVACALTSLIESEHWRRTHQRKQLDYMALYLTAKDIDGNTDAGTTFSSGFKAAVKLGYIPAASVYHDLTTLDDVRFALHTYSLVLGGLQVTDGWSHCGDDGFVPADEGNILGGHAVLLCAYNLIPACVQWVGWKNSWGGWGAAGFGRMSVQHFKRFWMGGAAIDIA